MPSCARFWSHAICDSEGEAVFRHALSSISSLSDCVISIPKLSPNNMTETARLLVVSRDSAVLRPFWSIAESQAWHVESVVSAWEAMERVQSGVAPHLLVLDLPRGDSDALHILRWL